MKKLKFEIVEDAEPDPAIEAWLDYLSRLSKIADTYYMYACGPPRDRDKKPGQTP